MGQILTWPNPMASRTVRVGGARDGADGGVWLEYLCDHLPQGNLVPPDPL